MTFAAELRAALPRGVAVEHDALRCEVRLSWRHAHGGYGMTVDVHGLAEDDVIAHVARDLRRHVERWGPIVAEVVAEAGSRDHPSARFRAVGGNRR